MGHWLIANTLYLIYLKKITQNYLIKWLVYFYSENLACKIAELLFLSMLQMLNKKKNINILQNGNKIRSIMIYKHLRKFSEISYR